MHSHESTRLCDSTRPSCSISCDYQGQLKGQLIKLGDIEHAVDDTIGFMQQTESDLQNMDVVCCDPNIIESQLKMIQVGFRAHLTSLEALFKAATERRLALGPLRKLRSGCL